MSQPVPSPSDTAQPEAVQPEDAAVAEAEIDADAEEQPLNRAARRAKAKGADPSHVGPRGSNIKPGGKGPRSHSKRPS